MDPITVIGLIASVQDLLVTTYNVGKDTINAKAEIRALCVELSSLKTTLEHIGFILGFAESENGDEGSDDFLNKSALFNPEYQKRLKSINGVLTDLYNRLKARSTQLGKVWQITTWHWQKGEFDKILQKLEREKSWFTMAASSETLSLTRESLRSIQKVEGILESQQTTRKNEEVQALRSQVREWLAPHSTEALYSQSLNRLQAGTGAWLYESEVFKAWIRRESKQGLWLKARPGFGKTTLMAGAVDTIYKLYDSLSEDIAIAYWFCSLTETSSRELNNLLGGLIYQLGCSNPLLFSRLVDEYYARRKKLRQPEQEKLGLDELKRLFQTMTQDSIPLYVLIDAVNESKDTEKLLAVLNEMLGDCKNFRVFISSTGTTILDADTTNFEIIAAGKDTNAMDIDTYIKAKLSEKSTLRRLSNKVKNDILIELNQSAGGVFRWVDCQLQALALQKSPRDIQKALLCLPKTLEQSYQQSLDQLPENDRYYADKILFWLCYAYRRMSLRELCEAVILEEGEVFDPDSRFSDPYCILEICPSLLDFDHHRETLGLAHSSVFDYVNKFIVAGECKATAHLLSDSMTDEERNKAADTKIASICLSYLLQPEFSLGWMNTEDEDVYYRWSQTWPLLRYISVFLWIHLEQVDLAGSVAELLKQFISSHDRPRGGNFGAFLQAYYVLHEGILLGPILDETTPLYWAARSGNSSIVHMILQSGGMEMLECKGGIHMCTPLHVASWAGRTEVVKALLEAGAEVNEGNEQGHSGLDWAIVHGWHDIVEMLMKAGGRPNKDNIASIMAEEGHVLEVTGTQPMI